MINFLKEFIVYLGMMVYICVCTLIYMLINSNTCDEGEIQIYEGGLGVQRKEPKSVRHMPGAPWYIFVAL